MIPRVVRNRLYPFIDMLAVFVKRSLGFTENFQILNTRWVQTSSVLCKNIRAGKVKSDKFKKQQLTYERALPPYTIGYKKSWLSWNTSNLKDEEKSSERAFEDLIIRKFINGTWVAKCSVISEIIIKRRYNCIYVAFIVKRQMFEGQQIPFLIGYTEEMLSILLKCPVKCELHLALPEDVVYTIL